MEIEIDVTARIGLAELVNNDYAQAMAERSNLMPARIEPVAPSAMDASEQAAFEASVKQGLAELDAGLYVSGPEVEAWAKSLFSKTKLPVPAIRRRVRS